MTNHIRTVAQIVSVTLIFLFSMVFTAAYLPDINQWLDIHFDRTDQQRTGIAILGIGSVMFTVLFFTNCLKRK